MSLASTAITNGPLLKPETSSTAIGGPMHGCACRTPSMPTLSNSQPEALAEASEPKTKPTRTAGSAQGGRSLVNGRKAPSDGPAKIGSPSDSPALRHEVLPSGPAITPG